MALLPFPNIKPQTTEWSLYVPKSKFESRNGAYLEKIRAVPKWRVSLTFTNVRASLIELQILVDKMKLGDTCTFSPCFGATNNISGTVTTVGSSSGSQLIITGLAGVVHAGTYFQIGGELKRTTATRAGNGTVYFQPALRQTFAAGTPINFVNPNCAFRLATEDTGSLSVGIGLEALGLDLIEV
jgi:hypothetical protein